MNSTRYKAIMRWKDILLNHHEIYVWLFRSQQTHTINLADELLRTIKTFRSSSDSLSEYQHEVLTTASLLIDCHAVGLNFLQHSHCRLHFEGGGLEVEWKDMHDFHSGELEQWSVFFQCLLEYMLYVIYLFKAYPYMRT